MRSFTHQIRLFEISDNPPSRHLIPTSKNSINACCVNRLATSNCCIRVDPGYISIAMHKASGRSPCRSCVAAGKYPLKCSTTISHVECIYWRPIIQHYYPYIFANIRSHNLRSAATTKGEQDNKEKYFFHRDTMILKR